MSLYYKIYIIAESLKNTKLGIKLYGFLDDIGLRGGVNRFEHYIHKTQILDETIINNNILFFKDKEKEIAEVCGLLEDTLSKRTLQSMIKYRCSGKYKDLPPNAFSTQYFKNNFFSYYDNECFIDCGAFDGDTILRFKRIMNKKRKTGYRIIAFEPDHNNAIKLHTICPEAICIEKGVWNEESVLYFKSDSSMASTVVSEVDENVVTIPVTAIDLCSECKDASFIKMDIEGSEYNALLGARKTIQQNKSKLAICIYHSNEDMLRLIKLVHEMVPEYKLYVRQHTNALCETVLYACV